MSIYHLQYIHILYYSIIFKNVFDDVQSVLLYFRKNVYAEYQITITRISRLSGKHQQKLVLSSNSQFSSHIPHLSIAFMRESDRGERSFCRAKIHCDSVN